MHTLTPACARGGGKGGGRTSVSLRGETTYADSVVLELNSLLLDLHQPNGVLRGQQLQLLLPLPLLLLSSPLLLRLALLLELWKTRENDVFCTLLISCPMTDLVEH